MRLVNHLLPCSFFYSVHVHCSRRANGRFVRCYRPRSSLWPSKGGFVQTPMLTSPNPIATFILHGYSIFFFCFNLLHVFCILDHSLVVEKLRDRFMESFNRQDVEATSQLFTEDRIIMRTGMDAVHGREGHFASLLFFR